MSMQRAKALREEAGRLYHEGKTILETAETEKRELSAEENQRYKDIADQVEAKVDLANTIERQERARVETATADTAEPDARTLEIDPDRQQSRDQTHGGLRSEEYATAFRSFLKSGLDRMNPKERAVLQVDQDDVGGFVSASYRLVDGVLKALRDRLVIMQQARVYPCNYGETIGQLGMTANIGDLGWVGELNDAAEKESVKWYKRELKPKLMENFIVPISIFLVRNAMIDVEAEVSEEAAIAQAVTLEKAFMLGDGAHKPLGLFVASDEGIPTSRDSATDMTATDITGDGLIEAQDMLDEAHQPNASWLFHRKAITKIRKLKNSVSGDYIWQPGLRAGEPNTILGKPYNTGTYVPNTFTSGKYVGLYGDMSQYVVAAAENMEIIRLVEQPYAGKNQIGLLFRNAAYDGMPRRADAFVRIKMGS